MTRMRKVKLILAFNRLSIVLQKANYVISVEDIECFGKAGISIKVIDKVTDEIEIEKKFFGLFDDEDGLNDAVDLIYEIGFLMGNQGKLKPES